MGFFSLIQTEYFLPLIKLSIPELLLLLQDGSTRGTTPLFIVFLCTMTIGTILMCFLSNRSAKEKEKEQESSVSFCSSVISLSKAAVALLLDIRLLLVIPLIAYSGFQQAFVW